MRGLKIPLQFKTLSGSNFFSFLQEYLDWLGGWNSVTLLQLAFLGDNVPKFFWINKETNHFKGPVDCIDYQNETQYKKNKQDFKITNNAAKTTQEDSAYLRE